MEQGDIALSDSEFARVQRRVYTVAGIALNESKRTLVVSRLTKLVKALGLNSFGAYLDYLEAHAGAGAAQDFVNALTTNLTRFYREDYHFPHLVDYVQGLLAQRPRLGPDGRPRLRIWSAGCSTGQEPYTVAMCLLSALPDLRRWDFKILATDVDTVVIEKAASGTYPQSELNGLSTERAAQLEKLPDGRVRVPAMARHVVSFKPLNLMDVWPMRGPFDAIFCRNVAIYFDRPTQVEMFTRLGAMLAPGGYLYIGHSENISGGGAFKMVGKTTYQVRQAAKRAAA